MNNAITSYLEAICTAIAIFWDTLCYPVRNLAIDYDNLDTEDFVYEPSQEEIAEYQRIRAEMLK